MLELGKERAVILDGAMGTTLQGLLGASEACNEAANLTRPDVVRDIHRSFLSVGCDGVLTNTFGANGVVLREFGLADASRELNRRAAGIARRACEEFASPGRPRFVVGSVGPGTKLPSLRQIAWDELVSAYREQALGLLEGGADAILVETCQDILQAKSAIVAACDAMDELRLSVPVLCTVTIEAAGTMLVGTEIAAAVAALQAYRRVAAIGLNCATGPREMGEHVRYLSAHCDRLLIVQPNAGIPQVTDGRPQYPLTPPELARWLREFVEVHGVNIVGGCCGTTPEHLAAVVEAVSGVRPAARPAKSEPAVSSVYRSVAIRQDADLLAIGERANANGSKAFREMLAAGDLDGMAEAAREQVRQGSHLIDVCVAHVGRDEAKDMASVIARLSTDIAAPLVLDSADPLALEAGLRLAGGRCVINSASLESGDAGFGVICELAQRYGAALVALTIDEGGVARTADRKAAVARRMFDLATARGMAPHDLIFDPLTFTICTGGDGDRRLALETLDAIGRIKHACPGSHTLLGVSNVSFGLEPAARRVLNSVFAHCARERGLDAAILNPASIIPMHQIGESKRRLAEDTIFARFREGYDPLTEFVELFGREGGGAAAAEAAEPKPVEERLRLRIINGSRAGLEGDLDEALLSRQPLDIVNAILLDGMRAVGDLFGAGRTQLPFVLRSAEIMRAAMQHLEPHMGGAAANRGTIVLATVRGDMHDIGKNLVDIILTNNGFRVVNLGTNQPLASIAAACAEHGADAIGMSGLLVKSALVMRENLMALGDRGVDIPVILGGAALTREYVEGLRAEYGGPLFYAKDAFSGLRLMEGIMSGVPAPAATPPARAAHVRGAVPQGHGGCGSGAAPEPPFYGSRVVEDIEPEEVLAYLDEQALFRRWGYRRRGGANFARPILRSFLETCRREGLLRPKAIYGFWPAQSEGDELIIYDPDERSRRLQVFGFPRARSAPRWCLSDLFLPASGGARDAVAFSIVTAGPLVADAARERFRSGRYADYAYLHGVGAGFAEALAELVHGRVRADWGIAGAEDARGILARQYRGARYSFGFPACPRLEDQAKLWPLLRPERIGVSLTDGFQLEPEQTTTALIACRRRFGG